MLAIVPVKGVNGAKTRLAARLSARERAALVRDMLERVLSACEGSSAIARTLLVTPDPRFAPDGVDVLQDAGTGHADAVALALADPRAAAGAVVVMADCPLTTSDALDELTAAARPLALAPADDGGMNALALGERLPFVPAFGTPVERTIARARAAGIEPVVVADERLGLDVDRPEDYDRLLACR